MPNGKKIVIDEQTLQIIRAEISFAVKTTVNGKIDNIQKEMNEHMEELKPYMQFASGLGIIWKAIVFLGSLAVGWATIKSAFPDISVHF